MQALEKWGCMRLKTKIRELRINLAAVRGYNTSLANENHRLRTELDGLGQKLIGEIIKQGMFAVHHPESDEPYVFVWAGNANEQLECVIAEFL
jgi:regulator of replication initiation timing